MKRLILIVGLLSISACAHPKPDTSQLSAQGLQAYRYTQAVMLVNDAQTAVIADNKIGQLPDAWERQILTIIQQVRDVVREEPPDVVSRVRSVLKNGRQALPPEVDAAFGNYLAKVIGYIEGVTR